MNLLCIGHRGAKGHLPENTLPSFEKALKLGCHWVELDVHLAQGELLVIHDQTVDRTTNGKGRLKDMTLAEIRRLDAGQGAKVPLLREVINLVDRRAGVNIELKGAGTAVAVSRLLDEYCDAGWSTDDFLLSSFIHDELKLASKDYRRGLLFGELAPQLWQRAETLGGWSVNLYRKQVSQVLVNEAHEQGYKVLVHTVNDPAEICAMISLGVDGVFSDYPDRVLQAIDV